jgi:hypothetical protein
MGEHHVPLQIDENNNVTKVGHDMGGSYEIKGAVQLELFPTPVNAGIYEQCILCGVETTTLKTTHVDFRTGYIEGAGQLCRECYMKGNAESREHISIPKHFVKTYSNDMELGRQIRKYYYENY